MFLKFKIHGDNVKNSL